VGIVPTHTLLAASVCAARPWHSGPGQRASGGAQGRLPGSKLLGYDPYIKPEQFADLGVEPVTLDDLLRRSDYVTLHCPLVVETRGLIGAAQLALIAQRLPHQHGPRCRSNPPGSTRRWLITRSLGRRSTSRTRAARSERPTPAIDTSSPHMYRAGLSEAVTQLRMTQPRTWWTC
jgi:hypothetical protein